MKKKTSWNPETQAHYQHLWRAQLTVSRFFFGRIGFVYKLWGYFHEWNKLFVNPTTDNHIQLVKDNFVALMKLSKLYTIRVVFACESSTDVSSSSLSLYLVQYQCANSWSKAATLSHCCLAINSIHNLTIQDNFLFLVATFFFCCLI